MVEVSLKELVESKFEDVDRRLGELTRAIERLAEGTIRQERFQSTVHKVEKLQAMVDELEDQIDAKTEILQGKITDLEMKLADANHQLKNYRYIGGIIVLLLVGVISAWIKQMLGL